MKVLYASDLLGPHDYRFLEALLGLGHRVTLVSYLWDIDRPNFTDRSFDVRTLPGLEIVREASLCALPREGRLAGLRHRLLMKRRAAHFRTVVRRVRPDVIHAGWVQTSGWYAAESGFRPVVLMPWGSDILLDGAKGAMRERAKRVLGKADAVTCDCELVKREIQRLVPIPDDRFLVLPWGVDLGRFRDPGPRRGPPIVISTRTFRSVYAIDAVIRAFSMLPAETGVRLHLAGDGPERDRLQALAAELGVDGRVRWLGYLGEEAVARALSEAHVYVSPSLSDGSSVSLLEAMACGLPAAVSDLPANREWVSDGAHGRLVKPGDADDLAARLGELLAAPARARAMGEAARSVIRERADWHMNVRQLDGLYARALGRTGAAVAS